MNQLLQSSRWHLCLQHFILNWTELNLLQPGSLTRSPLSIHHLLWCGDTETSATRSPGTGPKLVYNPNKTGVTRGKTKQGFLKTGPWRLRLQRELLSVHSAGCELHTAQGMQTSFLSTVTVVPTVIKDANEKGRLADVAWWTPFFSFFCW